MTHSAPGRRIPADSFRIRLAIVRALMGWNYDQAEAATGVSSESWRLWEKGRRCTDVVGVSRRIAVATGYDETWLALGGPLSEEEDAPARPRPTRGVPSQSSHEFMSSPRPGHSPIAAMLDPEINRRRVKFENNLVADLAEAI